MDIEKKFLIIRLGAIGDIVHCLPVACAIRRKFPNAQIDWVVGDKFIDLVKNNPVINNFYIANLTKWRQNWLAPSSIGEILALSEKLRSEHYDYSLDLHGMFKSLIIQAFSGAKQRIGYSDYRELAVLGCNFLVKPKSKRPHRNYHVIKRNLDILEGCGILTENELKSLKPEVKLPEATSETKYIIDNLLATVDKTKPIAVFAPATTWDNKHWDEANWQKLYDALKNEANIVFSGTAKDVDLINRITNNDENAIVLAGKTNLNEYIELLRRAKVVVSPDSSAAHLAWAVKKPVVITIFCATSKKTFAPLGQIAFPSEKEICTPCHKRKCKNPICTSQTSADEVLQAINKVLK